MTIGQVHIFELGSSGIGSKLFGAWCEAHLAVFEFAGQSAQIETFDGSYRLWSTSRFVLTKSACTGISLLRSPEPTKIVLLDHFGIRLLVAGSVAGTMGTRKLIAGAGDLVCFDLQQSILLESSTEPDLTSDLTLWIPRSRVQALIADEILLHGLVLRGTTPGGTMLGAALTSLAIHADHMRADEMDAAADGLIELAAKLLVFPLEAMKQSQTAVPTASFVTVRRFIDRNLQSRELDVDMIAKRFGLSRASLYRLFEPIGGIASYIRKQRLDRAFQEITAVGFANSRIGPIAYRCGFKSIAAFNRAFRETYGMNPTEARSTTSGIFPRRVAVPASEAGILAQRLLETSSR